MVVTEPPESKTRPQEPVPDAESGVGEGDGERARLQDELARAQAGIAELKDQFLRARADVENVRRRGESDVANARKFAIERFAGDMLNVRDSLELALSVELPRTGDPLLGKMLEGVMLTLKQLDAVFERYSLEAIVPARGDRLDPERHQAMTTQVSNEAPAGHVLTLIQRGYLLNGRLLRPAVVIVASADAPTPGH